MPEKLAPTDVRVLLIVAATLVMCSVPFPVSVTVTVTGFGGKEQSDCPLAFVGQAVKVTAAGDSEMPAAHRPTPSARLTGIACVPFAAFGATTLAVAVGAVPS